MADEEHLRLLNQGVDVWNKWREEHHAIYPSLSGADLSGVNLSEADLTQADLSEADLMGADLTGAHLASANLAGADLTWACLAGAVLNWANLTGADLTGADLAEANLAGADLTWAYLAGTVLTGADLTNAHLDGANLDEAEFTGIRFGWTKFGAVDLSTVTGLGTAKHDGPSTIGIDTIYKSKGKIPEAFLRGAGVPDEFIACMGSLVGRVIGFSSCFISYSSQDQDFVDRLNADLQAKNVRCWCAPERMEIGDKFRPRIDEAIRLYDKLLLVLSKSSVESIWVEKEVETAFEEERKRRRTVLFPVRLDDTVMETDMAWAADIRRTRHIDDFRGWKAHGIYQRGLASLLRDLKASEQSGAPAAKRR